MKFFSEKTQPPSKEKVLDNRTLLRYARQCLDENDMEKARQFCKKVLRKNNESYMALVLLGKSYGKSDEAAISYQKAIDMKPNHLLAWQGLANYYEEKTDEYSKMKLLMIYDKIITLNIEEDYAIKTLTKYAHLAFLLKHDGAISSLLHFITIQDNVRTIETAKKQILKLLHSQFTCKNEDIPAIINIFKDINTDYLTDGHLELIFFGYIILRNNDFVSAIETIMALGVFPKSLPMKKWLCKLLCENFIKNDSFYGFDIDKHMNVLIMGIEDTKYANFLTAITYYRCKMFEEAYRKCVSILRQPFDMEEIEARFLFNCCVMTPDKKRTKQLCLCLLKKIHLYSPAFIITLHKYLLSYHMEEKEFYHSLHNLSKIPIVEIDSILLTELANLYLETHVVNRVAWDLLKETDYIDFFKALAHIKVGKFSEAIEVLKVYDKHPLKYYYLALAYWFNNLNDESFENFQIAAVLNPNHPKVHYCLGIHYYRHKDDIEESRKYFEKSYALCKTDINVVKMLSIIYVRLDLVELEFELLQTAFHTPQTRELWVCSKLGRICYGRGIMDEALIYLQAAINIDPTEVTALEWVGDIHFSTKNYDEALTAYNKVVELSQDSVTFFKCLNRIGCIYSNQMSYYKAIYVFDNILDKDPGNVAALKGIIENRVIVALKNITNDLFQDAREQIQRAADRITTAISLGIKDLVYWHLYGDVLIFMTRLPNEYCFINLEGSEGPTRKEKIDIYKMAIESYSNVVKFRDSGALFKCALAYFEYFSETKDLALCKTSFNLAVLNVKVNPNLWPVWDLLGKVCLDLNKFNTSFYCFSKALALFENKDCKIWCEVGVFYVKFDKQQVSRYWNVIEQPLPSSTPAWIRAELSDGSGSEDISEFISDNESSNSNDEENIDSTETVDSYPWSTPTNKPTFDLPIESLKTVPNGTEIIEWYLCFEEESAWSCCSLGNLQERKGLFIPALRYYDRAYVIADNQLKNEILSHKGRVLMKMQEYEEAINMYNGIREKNLEDTCALGHALYKIDKLKKSYATYDVALTNLCENDDQRADLLITMSNVAYRLNGLPEGALLLLKAVKIKHGEDQGFNLSFLKSYTFKKVDIQLMSHVMTEYLHKDIDKATWWYYMGLNYLRGINKYAKLTRACIKRAIRVNTDNSRNGKLLALFSAAEFYAGNRKSSLYHATQALKHYPLQPELWAVFILCIYADKAWPRRASFMLLIINTVRTLITVSQPMDKWLTKVEEETIGSPKKFNFTFECNSMSP